MAAHAFSVTVRNAILDVIETTIGTTPVFKIRTGAAPGITAADSGTVLVSMTLPSNWMNTAAAGVKTLLGTWQGTAIATGTAGHWRLYASNGTTQHDEGSVSAVAGGGAIVLLVNGVAGTTITLGDLVSIEVWTLDF